MGKIFQHASHSWTMLTTMLVTASLLPHIANAARTKAIIPLYVEVEDHPRSWDPLYKVITTHPNVDFTIIVNPDDGPGKKALPSTEWSQAAAKLKSSRNVQLLGYVKIGYANRSFQTVTDQIAKYAGWAAKRKSISVDGIFLDEAPYVWNETTSKYLTNLHSTIKSAAGLGKKLITINPGLPPDEQYFNIADTVCVVEQKHSFWVTDDCKKRVSGIMAPRDRRCIIVHSATGLNRSGYADLVKDVEDKAGNIFVTDIDKDYYGKWGKSYPLDAFVGDIDK
ncbi:hypothetical protein BT63DRAFT_461037 [Microthyrium microscopicum]|uniref:Spherulation-specific family 4 n=1 Tax=Microthyrium microscopicum TaxID=703497 RepID=A0A6A6TV20_9PEZI|nr:hypothetical protein BT63DRAFT_461037 [Microthyrium microscopicum]